MGLFHLLDQLATASVSLDITGDCVFHAWFFILSLFLSKSKGLSLLSVDLYRSKLISNLNRFTHLLDRFFIGVLDCIHH